MKSWRQNMLGRPSVSHQAVKWIFIGTAAIAAGAATRLYYVQEMLAALLLFAVVFSCAAATLLILFILDRAGEAALGFLESRGRALVEHARGRRPFSEHWYKT
jgi:hypothetical protein